MTTYPSKIGLELVIPIAVIIGGVGALIVYQRDWSGLLPLVTVTLFLIHLFLTTRYTISRDKLIVKCSVLFKRTVNIQTINKISETRNPISAPAGSLDRLEITYNKFDRVIISPQDKNGFIKQIKRINPKIELYN